MPGRTFKDCEYSAFISYAHADDLGWNSWVTGFNHELVMTLPTRVRNKGITVPPTHLSGKNGPIMGDLGPELRARIAASFVMILVVHDNYAESGWCQQELAYFKSLFGDDGFRERLYIVAMSKTAIEQLVASDDWKRVTPGTELVWMPFFQPEEPDMPIGIYSDERRVAAQAFWGPFVKLREDLAKKIKANAESQPRTDAPALNADSDTVRIYIESNQNEAVHWEAIGAQVVNTWDQRVVAGMALAPPLYVRPSGLPIERIDDFPLDDADGVVLLWGQKTPDSLVAQIAKVEGKLLQADLPPVVVARIVPASGELEAAVSAFGWPVVRFQATAGEALTVLAQDAQRFEAFLRQVLARKKQRRAASRAAQLATQP